MNKVAFYIQYPYYFPHFLPIGNLLTTQGYDVVYILSEKQNTKNMIDIAQKHNLTYKLGEDNLYSSNIASIFFANNFLDAPKLSAKTLFMDHGVGTKHCDYATALEIFDIVLVEGDYRYNSLVEKFIPQKQKVHKVGFSKLDFAFHFQERDIYIKKYNLNNQKQTILYAPTFFPSSIEKMSDSFPDDFKEYNIIIKPHYLSLHRSRYKGQRKKFQKWASYSNCSVCDESEYSLVPFLNLADIMISDESSAIFEFTALDKPVILNRFLKLRWSYYLNPKKLIKRLDPDIEIYRTIGDNAKNYKEMVEMVKENLQNKNKYKEQRISFTKDICGQVDGQVSQRIVNLLQKELL